MSNCVLISFR